ncbi:MAG: hypothetical protein QOD05_1284 [Microbacteriaceae bacterium]|jgi:hypothetical protein|nr:hypothetical protein [Microbacteriaceae bacterium]
MRNQRISKTSLLAVVVVGDGLTRADEDLSVAVKQNAGFMRG